MHISIYVYIKEKAPKEGSGDDSDEDGAEEDTT